MKKIIKASILTLLVLASVLSPVLCVTAQAATISKYDPFTEGIVSSYYHIDKEKGFITGIAPGTVAQHLINVCLPAEATVSHEKLVTGATMTVTCTAPTPPETQPEETEPPVSGETTDVTEPPVDTTEAPTESAEETTLPDDTTAQTAPPEETTEETHPPVETTEETQPPEETTETEPPADTIPEPETKTYTLTVIVTGDLNGDGEVTITDMLKLKSAVLGEKLSDTAAAAADINYDGKVTITDFLKAKACLLGLESIAPGWPTGEQPSDPLLLMTPDSFKSWSVPGAASYITDNESLVIVDEMGTIAALSKEGTTFVYAMDENGNIIARTLVTVFSKKLAISLGADEHHLIMGQSLALNARFNQPITDTITWASSNSAVVTVDQNGNVTTTGLGTATIIASLPNGFTAMTVITVTPPVKAITFGKALYKIKPGSSHTLDVTVTPGDTGEELIWSSSNTSIATVSGDGTVTGHSKGTVTITAKGKYSGLSASCSVKICDVKQVAITFDDGPGNCTSDLLDQLRELDVSVTFFLVGNRIESYPNTIKRMVADGHEIGYHSYAHAFQSYLPLSQVSADLKTSNKILKDLTGAEFTVWRAPGGDYNRYVLNAIPLPHISWSVDTRDWETQSVESNYRSIIGSRDGDIILLHDLYRPSVNGAIKAIKEMLAGDYEFLTVTELLSRNGTPPKNSENYFRG